MRGPIVLYDDDCGFCRWSAERLRVWDRRGDLRFATIQGPEGDRRLHALDHDARLASWHVVASDGRVWSAGAAVPVLLRHLPGGAPLAALADTFPVSTDRLYRWTARNRTRLGAALGTRACAVDPGRHAVAR